MLAFYHKRRQSRSRSCHLERSEAPFCHLERSEAESKDLIYQIHELFHILRPALRPREAMTAWGRGLPLPPNPRKRPSRARSAEHPDAREACDAPSSACSASSAGERRGNAGQCPALRERSSIFKLPPSSASQGNGECHVQDPQRGRQDRPARFSHRCPARPAAPGIPATLPRPCAAGEASHFFKKTANRRCDRGAPVIQ